MDRAFYQNLADQGLAKRPLEPALCRQILLGEDIELLSLLHAAFEVRKAFTGKEIKLHIINNAQNGYCPEDCSYCAQAKTSDADIAEYPLKLDAEILDEAKAAHEAGAFRYCMVFAGRGPSQKRVEHLARLIKTIKAQYPLQICVSAGILDEQKAKFLKEAGLDRLNHNLNTSEQHYPKICTTHTYRDRINTLKAAHASGLQVCSGIIVGMGESADDVVDVAQTLRTYAVRSIPVNFLIPIPGNTLKSTGELTPDYCLRVLCLFRLLNPDAEIRVAAGREVHLRSMEVLALYPANSLFLEGYLNTQGSSSAQTLRMIQDAGFSIKSTHNLEELLQRENAPSTEKFQSLDLLMKDLKDLRRQAPTP